jgi:hypothetical protein
MFGPPSQKPGQSETMRKTRGVPSPVYYQHFPAIFLYERYWAGEEGKERKRKLVALARSLKKEKRTISKINIRFLVRMSAPLLIVVQ